MKLTTVVAMTALISFLIFYGKYLTYSQAPATKLNSETQAASYYSLSKKNAISKSRNSSVRVLSVDMEKGMVSTSSATYFKYKSEYFILTTNHGLLGGCGSIQIEADGELFSCIEIIITNSNTDYAIMKVDEIKNRKALNFPNDTVRGLHRWSKTLTLLNEIVYTGYPNATGPLTIDGKIMGFDNNGLIYVDSYAWSGSSGSGVFDKNGKLLGYILAIDVGDNEYGTTVLENVMLVVPLHKIDWSVILMRGQKID